MASTAIPPVATSSRTIRAPQRYDPTAAKAESSLRGQSSRLGQRGDLRPGQVTEDELRDGGYLVGADHFGRLPIAFHIGLKFFRCGPCGTGVQKLITHFGPGGPHSEELYEGALLHLKDIADQYPAAEDPHRLLSPSISPKNPYPEYIPGIELADGHVCDLCWFYSPDIGSMVNHLTVHHYARRSKNEFSFCGNLQRIFGLLDRSPWFPTSAPSRRRKETDEVRHTPLAGAHDTSRPRKKLRQSQHHSSSSIPIAANESPLTLERASSSTAVVVSIPQRRPRKVLAPARSDTPVPRTAPTPPPTPPATKRPVGRPRKRPLSPPMPAPNSPGVGPSHRPSTPPLPSGMDGDPSPPGLRDTILALKTQVREAHDTIAALQASNKTLKEKQANMGEMEATQRKTEASLQEALGRIRELEGVIESGQAGRAAQQQLRAVAAQAARDKADRARAEWAKAQAEAEAAESALALAEAELDEVEMVEEARELGGRSDVPDGAVRGGNGGYGSEDEEEEEETIEEDFVVGDNASDLHRRDRGRSFSEVSVKSSRSSL